MEKYVPPPVPRQVAKVTLKSPVRDFGTDVKTNYFLLERECTFLNHGAFGAVLKDALLATQAWQMYIEQQPLRFYDRELLPLLAYVSRRLAEWVGCDPTDLVLVQNATTAINCVLRSQNWLQGDQILCLSTTYGAVKKMLRQVCEDTGAVLHECNVTFPLTSDQQIVDLISEALSKSTYKLAVFDHIPSNTPFILPVVEVVKACHDRGCKVIIDGAHALGQLDLNMKYLGGVDYYISNAHKWFCAPKGAAFLYVDKKHQASTRPLIISHGHGSGFNSEFIWSGLRDYSPFLALLTVIDFWKETGADDIRSYIYNLAKQAANLLVEKWNTTTLVPLHMTGSMLCVQLPEQLSSSEDVSYSTAEKLQNILYHDHNIEVPVKAIQGKLYVRISCHIHNCLTDYEKLANAVLDINKSC